MTDLITDEMVMAAAKAAVLFRNERHKAGLDYTQLEESRAALTAALGAMKPVETVVKPIEALRLVEDRLSDLREANDLFRTSTRDRSNDIQRNGREIGWLLDFRELLRSPLPTPPSAGE